ncbi:39S ribosomal protein L12, mitochondrial [Rhinatrema bivittatum]|uniref:39S ribosomal protein L12, mitochondrial n=1 Tax=Rhinatrema bivittatum TaxID=194408 RepID=UPI00112E54DE|nr:39S ribosomal protein L12, mitochondrial [Rhinatrema bivittatum]
MLSVGHLGRASLRLCTAHRQQLLRLCSVRMVRMSSEMKNEVLASPPLDNATKEYPPKIQHLVNEIAGLTLLEISELNDLLKKTLKIENMGMMPMGAVMSGPGAQPAAQHVLEEDDAPTKKEKSLFTVKLTELNAADKVKLIKEVKNYMQGLNLVQAKKLVESLPQEIRANVSKDEAEKIKAALEAAGGKVVLE